MKYKEFNLDNKVLAITTTVSLGNMAFQVDSGEDVFSNRKELCKLLNIDTKHLVLAHQSHSSIMKKVTKEDLGKGEKSFESGISADGLYTNEKDIAIAIFHADCVPIFFYDEKKGNVGIIHCGLKGTLNHASKVMLETYIKETSSNPSDIKVYIGPSRRVESFEITDELREQLDYANLNNYIENNHFNMPKVTLDGFVSLGLNPKNIIDSQIDNVLDTNYFSAFKKTPVGRMVSLIKFR